MELYTIGVIIPGTVLEPEQAPFEQLIPLLEVPVSCVSNYPIKPFKWLRYITGVILDTEGDLLTPNGEVMDYEQTGPIHKKLSYQPNSVVKFLDPSAINHLQSSQFTTESRVEFRDAIEERDHKCVTGQFNARHCIAAHLIPHSKGNQYIQTLCDLRDLNGEPRIENICDVRNGLFLNAIMDQDFTQQTMSVMRTPNFAMSVDEVNPPNLAQSSRRFTAHSFFLGDTSEAMSKEINAPERIIDDWPPRSLLDLHYGVVCFNKFGIKTYVQPLINAEYYPEGVETHNERMKKELGLAKQKAEEEKVREREEVPDDMFDIVLKTSLWFRETFRYRNEEYQTEAARLEEERNRKVHDISVDKVERWMQSTAFTAF